jgi:hypothetical protein
MLLNSSYFVLSLTAAIGFPVIIMLLLPVRTHLIPRLPFTKEELAILDGPAASPFVSRPSVISSSHFSAPLNLFVTEFFFSVMTCNVL